MSDPRRPAPAAILRKLDRTLRTRHLVRVHRTIPDADTIDGFVLGTNPEWTLLAECPEVRLDGFTAIRTPDIARIRKHGDEDSLTIRALRRRGQWPPPPSPVTFDDLPGLLTSAARHHTLLTVHLEHEAPDIAWIGTVARLTRKTLRLHQIDPDARWHPRPTKFPLAAITQVAFGSHYEHTLEEFADAPAPTARH
ncbi:hypothetical protein GCM10020229_51880 [Kitasatospora albolonga]|uniref:hypothetical protein n=1 Tax=Kitasatospora albolonga TaxID=68173 RepID=UPI0031EB4F55